MKLFRPSVANIHGTSYTQLDAEPDLSECLQMINGYCPSGLLIGLVRHTSTWTGKSKGHCSPFLNGMRSKPGPPQAHKHHLKN